MKIYCGDGISFYRRIRNMKQEVLANYLGMSRQNLSQIERNKRMVSIKKIYDISKLLETTSESIINHPLNNNINTNFSFQEEQNLVFEDQYSIQEIKNNLNRNQESITQCLEQISLLSNKFDDLIFKILK